ncbi:long-chain-fatty-acid--CoA ligase [Caldisphaera sp.]|uniref:long-chain-fatty-acid--CoA ligase n=1 Tax=Caldisphaera sp. TaxID=2060322 RepID=UPI003D0FB57D
MPEKVPERPGYDVTLRYIYDRMENLFPDVEIAYKTNKGIFHYTYSDFIYRTQSLANALSSLDIKQLDKVATLDWNTHWHFELYFGVPLMGSILHPVNIRLSPNELLYVFNTAEDKLLITHADFLQLAEAIASKIKSIKSVIVVDTDSVPQKIGGVPAYHYEDLIKEHKGRYEFPLLSEDRPAFMGFTSGTTGLPKGVYHSHKAMVLHAMSSALHFASFGQIKMTSNDIILHVVPMYHVYSWGLPFTSSLLGQKQVYPGRFNPKVYLDLIKNEKVTYFAGVPTILYMLLTDPDIDKYDLSNILFINGGSAIPEGLAYLATKKGIKVVVGYGLTETAPVLTLAIPPARYYNKMNDNDLFKIQLRTGYPIPLVDLKVVDANMNPVPKDGKTIGEIVVRSPWVAPEYYKDPEKTEKAWFSNWFHTGDLAVWYEDGSVLIMDRDKDVIKSGGEWISSLRLEDAISQHPGVSMVAVIAAKHEKWIERPVALIVPKKGWENKITTEEINNFLIQNFVNKGVMSKWWLPEKVVVVNEIPLSSTGKANKRILREQYGNILEKNL